MTANFDAAKSAALAVTMLDWRDFGRAYAAEMVAMARALAEAMIAEGLPVYRPERLTHSHQFALEAAPFGGGQAASKHLRRAGFLASGIGLPLPEVPGDANGIRLGTPELVRWGMTQADAPRLARLIARRCAPTRPKRSHPRSRHGARPSTGSISSTADAARAAREANRRQSILSEAPSARHGVQAR
jgi:glycine hydroxymethyltransferase